MIGFLELLLRRPTDIAHMSLYIRLTPISVFDKIAFIGTIFIGGKGPTSKNIVFFSPHWLSQDRFGSDIGLHEPTTGAGAPAAVAAASKAASTWASSVARVTS
jgi:hypothetical protein